MDERWTEARLRDWADGARLHVANATEDDSDDRPADSFDLLEARWNNYFELVFRPDRAPLMGAWKRARDQPGETTEAFCRVRTDSGWIRERVRFLDLRHEPEIGEFVTALDQRVEIAVFDTEIDVRTERYEASPWVILYIDAEARITLAAGMTQEVFGRSAEELVGTFSFDFVHPDDLGEVVALGLEVGAGQLEAGTLVHRVQRPDGTDVWVEGTVMNQHERFDANMVVFHDITEKRAREAHLQEMAEEFRLLAEEVPSAVFRANNDGELEFGNARWDELMEGQEAIGALRDIARETDRVKIDELIWDVVSRTSSEKHTVEITTANGRNLAITCRAVGHFATGSRKLIGAAEDITDTALLRVRAEYDPLTGSLNRDGITRRLASALADEDPVLVVFLDLDGFKEVNDSLGHHAGDLVLQDLARRLRQSLRPSDEIGRYGGDEFVIMCRDAPAGIEELILDRIAEAFDEPIAIGGAIWQPRASTGTTRPVTGDTVESLLDRADRLMYEHKRGRTGG